MNFDLSEDHKAIQEAARKFAQKELAPNKRALKEAGVFPKELLMKIGDLGFLGCAFPEKYGGTETGYLAQILIVEEIAKVLPDIASVFNMQAMTVPLTVLNWGNEEQRENYIPDTIKCRKIGFFGVSEPDAGADAGQIKTTANKDGNSYVLNGSKTWITFSPVSDWGLVFVKTNPEDPKHSLSCFIVDSHQPGISFRELSSPLLSVVELGPPGEIFFEDYRIPASNLLAEEGLGFRIMVSALNYGRLCVAARAVAMAQRALELSAKYSNERVQFGRPIGSFQMIQAYLAEMTVEIEAARMLVWKSAWLKDKGRSAERESSIAKLYAAEVANRVGGKAMEIHGAYGFHNEFEIGDYFIQGVISIVAEGSSNVNRIIVAKDTLGWSSADRYEGQDRKYPISFEHMAV
jgi:alkylation response protein AidB-like acyl-CoA dehydrogenase